MRALVQRVTRADVSVAGDVVGRIGAGLVILVGVTNTDTAGDATWIADKVADARIMADEQSLVDCGGQALVISQFTLYADTRKGRRPTWNAAAAGDVAEPLVAEVVRRLADRGLVVATGEFGADMQVSLINDGPMTILFESPARQPA